MDSKIIQILNMLDDLSSQDLQRVIMRAKVLSEKKIKEEAELREQERIRQEKIEQEKKRQAEIAELQKKIQELQNQKIDIPEEPCKAKGDGFVMYNANDAAKSVSSEPAPKVQPAPKEPAQITCPQCHQLNNAGSGFCLSCGYKFFKPQTESKTSVASDASEIVCPHCHQTNPADSMFCLGCGQKLTKSQPEPKAPSASPSEISCPYCHGTNPANSVFCLNCGHRI